MPSVFEIRDVNAFMCFAVWVLAITAPTKAVFRSFLAAEQRWWLRARSDGRERRINHLNWEVHHRLKYDPSLASGNPHAAKRQLSDDDVRRKRAELVALARGFDGLVPLTSSALAYSSGVVLLSALLGPFCGSCWRRSSWRFARQPAGLQRVWKVTLR